MTDRDRQLAEAMGWAHLEGFTDEPKHLDAVARETGEPIALVMSRAQMGELRGQLKQVGPQVYALAAARLDRELVHLRQDGRALCGHSPGYKSTIRVTDDPAEVVCKSCFDLMMAALRADNARLREALEKVAPKEGISDGVWGGCIFCGQLDDHAADCAWRKACAALAGEAP